ncbi:hypothetical protein [Chitinophaga flava]|uniref:Serpin domain-containing protein n=1 Tax=Chitinophaga flava TaxID=2259036 RepID=A0A365XXH0_9BACT|nr:hypothetical protein [Chitinophaga flava]RBL91079.1 hypothetical protein DF182_00195 [Chitinophaga flava]
MTRKLFSYGLLAGAISLTQCQPVQRNTLPAGFPEEISLQDLKATSFVTTPDGALPANRNVIYSSTLLLAWDALRLELGGHIPLSPAGSAELRLLNNTTSFRGSLDKQDYHAHLHNENNQIVVRAFFHKSLPFERPMQVRQQHLAFGNTRVRAFGMDHYDESLAHCIQVLFYEDDDHFMLKLIPKDDQQEIILAKGLPNTSTLGQALELIKNWEERGKKNMRNNVLAWKYQLLADDEVAIPRLGFNIGTRFPELEGQRFQLKDIQYTIEEARQQTAMVLNEQGAEVKSEAMIAVALDSTETPAALHPKKLMLNKPFLIIFRKKDQPNPYLAVQVYNTELMEKSR